MTTLTDYQKRAIERAREIASLRGIDAIREHTGESDNEMALSNAFGEAQYYLRELASLIGQLDQAP